MYVLYHLVSISGLITRIWLIIYKHKTDVLSQGWGVAVLVGVPHKDAVFTTHPMNFLNERTLKGTFFGNYKPRTDIPSVVEKYMNKVTSLEKLIRNYFILLFLLMYTLIKF